MEKEKKHAFGKDIYLLGKDKERTKYWLEQATFDCGWYFGFGYVETYTNNNNPEMARDIESHQHFDSLFLKNGLYYDNFRNFLVETPLSKNEIYKLCELMHTFYILKSYHALIHRGGANITKNSCYDVLKNDIEYNRLKNKVFPILFEEIYALLSPQNENKEENEEDRGGK